MRIRVGFGYGGASRTGHNGSFGQLVNDLERLGFDSLWVSERATGTTLDPMVAMAYAAGRTETVSYTHLTLPTKA